MFSDLERIFRSEKLVERACRWLSDVPVGVLKYKDKFNYSRLENRRFKAGKQFRLRLVVFVFGLIYSTVLWLFFFF